MLAGGNRPTSSGLPTELTSKNLQYEKEFVQILSPRFWALIYLKRGHADGGRLRRPCDRSDNATALSGKRIMYLGLAERRILFVGQLEND